MGRRRSWTYRKHWDTLIDLYGRLCFYCHEEIATTIDHVIPYSYDFDDSLENLVTACSLCNLIASDRHFDDVEQKRQFILNRRNRKGARRAICVDCFLPYGYRVHSPSLFLCAGCYDLEYGTSKAAKSQWLKWQHELRAADIVPEAHAELRANLKKFKANDREGMIAFLADAYERFHRNSE